MIVGYLQILGGRGASYYTDKRRTLTEYAKGKSGVIRPIDNTQYGALLSGEDAIRFLSKERALVYEDIAQSPIAAYQGTRHSVAIPTGEYTGKTLTHNHPNKKYAGTFSPADIYNATANNFKRMRAVGKEGNYYLMPGKNANPTGLASALQKNHRRLYKEMSRKYNDLEKARIAGKITYNQMVNRSRTEAVGILHRWYKDNAAQYGYTYGLQKKRSK